MIFTSGSITNSVKLAALENKWQQKKDLGNVLSKEERNERANWTQEQWMKHDFEEQEAQNREARKKTAIDNKIIAGETLTPDEEQYLASKDPAALEKYKQAKLEKKAYEEKLKRCKTKDEVQRLKTETMGGYLASIKKIENDPYIPKSEKLAKAREILAKSRNIEDAERKFMQTSEYNNLPTEAEETEERTEETRNENEEILSEMINKDDEELENEDIKVSEEENSDDSENSKVENEDNKVKKKKTKSETKVEIEKSYERIKFSAELELDSMNTSSKDMFKKNSGKKIDFSV